MTTFDEDYEKALNAAGEDVHVYLNWPHAVTTGKQRQMFEVLFKKWAKQVRTEGTGDITTAAYSIAMAHPNVTFGPDGTTFDEQIELMTHPMTLRNAVRKTIQDSHKAGNFVRFHVRSQKGQKIAFWA